MASAGVGPPPNPPPLSQGRAFSPPPAKRGEVGRGAPTRPLLSSKRRRQFA
ncbi:hypothetical protein FH063_000173 [Azospirillum argentinense]|uniref:Uncharacterized protein n=1 Tax=Azospirillum argentinense TaxID=2970906 RepID=A0A5B0L208_9PROT|nr:hypothetical protein FH063_000173 [Azospirillum argentinense]